MRFFDSRWGRSSSVSSHNYLLFCSLQGGSIYRQYFLHKCLYLSQRIVHGFSHVPNDNSSILPSVENNDAPSHLIHQNTRMSPIHHEHAYLKTLSSSYRGLLDDMATVRRCVESSLSSGKRHRWTAWPTAFCEQKVEEHYRSFYKELGEQIRSGEGVKHQRTNNPRPSKEGAVDGPSNHPPGKTFRIITPGKGVGRDSLMTSSPRRRATPPSLASRQKRVAPVAPPASKTHEQESKLVYPYTRIIRNETLRVQQLQQKNTHQKYSERRKKKSGIHLSCSPQQREERVRRLIGLIHNFSLPVNGSLVEVILERYGIRKDLHLSSSLKKELEKLEERYIQGLNPNRIKKDNSGSFLANTSRISKTPPISSPKARNPTSSLKQQGRIKKTYINMKGEEEILCFVYDLMKSSGNQEDHNAAMNWPSSIRENRAAFSVSDGAEDIAEDVQYAMSNQKGFADDADAQSLLAFSVNDGAETTLRTTHNNIPSL